MKNKGYVKLGGGGGQIRCIMENLQVANSHLNRGMNYHDVYAYECVHRKTKYNI